MTPFQLREAALAVLQKYDVSEQHVAVLEKHHVNFNQYITIPYGDPADGWISLTDEDMVDIKRWYDFRYGVQYMGARGPLFCQLNANGTIRLNEYGNVYGLDRHIYHPEVGDTYYR